MNTQQINYQEEIKKCKTMEDVTGKDGLMQRLLKDIIKSMLEGEMAHHLGRDKYERMDEPVSNHRNGHSKKTVKNSMGEIEVDIPRIARVSLSLL